MMEIRWTDEAEITFDVIYTFVENNWNAIIAEDFRYKVLKLLDTLSVQSLSFPETNIQNIRKAVITKQTSVFYEVHDKHVALLFFWDNRQKPIL